MESTRKETPGRNLPARNPRFRGRDDTLTALRDGLSQNSAVTLLGPAGCGKTQLAVEYAHRSLPEGAVVWWLRAGDRTTLAMDYAALLNSMGLSDLYEIERVRRATRRWLEEHPGWLLVFDEADDLDVVAPYLPQPSAGQVLVLSRADRAAAGTRALQVAPSLSRAESLALLREEINSTAPTAAQTLDTIAAQLHDHPLALALAGAFLRHEAGSAQEYLSLLLAQQRRHQAPPITTAVRVAMHRLEGTLATGLLPLYFFSFLRPPVNAYFLVPDHLRAASDRTYRQGPRRDNALLLLADLLAEPRSLVTSLLGLRLIGLLDLNAGPADMRPESMDVPRAVLEEVQSSLSPRDRQVWAQAALLYFLAAFPDQDKLAGQEGVLAFALVADALHVATLAQQAELPRQQVAALLMKVARFLYHFSDYQQTEQVMLRALRLAEPAERQDQPIIAEMYSVLCDSIKNQGRPGEAVLHAERALQLRRAACAPGAHEIEVAVAHANLGTLLCAAGRPQEARPHLSQALAMYRQRGAAPRMLIACQVSLGEAHRQCGDAGAARDCLQEAHALCEAQGLRGGDLSQVLLYLGLAWRDLGNKEQAEAHLSRSMEIDEKIAGRDYPGLLRVLRPLIELATERGDHKRARELAQRALSLLVSSGHATPGMLAGLGQLQGSRPRA